MLFSCITTAFLPCHHTVRSPRLELPDAGGDQGATSLLVITTMMQMKAVIVKQVTATHLVCDRLSVPRGLAGLSVKYVHH